MIMLSLNNKGIHVKGMFFKPYVCVCVCVLLIVEDITFNETAGKGSDIHDGPAVDS